MPVVSIILPFRDAGATLAECLQSIQAQTLGDFECLAIDDHSADDSAQQITALQDRRFRLLKNPGNGLVDALNFGLGEACTPMFARMDADDRMYPARLQRQYDYMTDHPALDLLACQVRKFPAARVQAGYQEYIRWQNDCLTERQINDAMYIESPLAHPSVMFTRRCIDKAGAYRNGPFPEDYDLWLRLFQAGCPMQKLDEVLLDWRESAGRLSRVSERYSRSAFDRLRAEYLSRDPRLQTDRPLAIWGAGRRTRRRVDHLFSYGFAPRAWIDIDPAKIGNVIAGVPVVAPDWLEQQSERPFVLNYVSNHGAREDIAAQLARYDYVCGRDYLHVG